MVNIVGNTDHGFIYLEESSTKEVSVRLSKFETNKKSLCTETIFKGHFTKNKAERANGSIKVVHVSAQAVELQPDCVTSCKTVFYLYLVAITTKKTTLNARVTKYSGQIYLVKSSKDEYRLLAKLRILDKAETEVRMNILSKCSEIEEVPSEDCENDSDERKIVNFFLRTKVLVCELEKGIMLYDVKATISTDLHGMAAKLEMLRSESVAKTFWWAQWLPLQECIAFANLRQPKLSSFEDEESKPQPPKPFLSVLQFHKGLPRESVLGMPLLLDITSEKSQPLIKLAFDPNILSSLANAASSQMKLLAHPSGAVYLFHVENETTNSILKCCLILLHHNKTLNVEIDLKSFKQTGKSKSTPLRIDVGLYSKDQYLMIVGWPYFIHFLDAGSAHEPSHHLVFEWSNLIKGMTTPFLCIFNARCKDSPANANEKKFKENMPKSDDKTDLSPKYSTVTHLLYEDLSYSQIELNSSNLLPMIEERGGDIRFKLAVLHHFLVHIGDINVAKRIIYDEGKKHCNLSLKKVYQEFLIGHSYLQAKKQILPNMDSFLYLIPYCADQQNNSTIVSPQLSIKLSTTDVSIMLLSPSQRVFPHNVIDLWTSLWNLNRYYSKGKRFSHKEISEKLMLSLQCYKPEAMSRANTPGPMSPSSPMICNSLGDISGLFGRRATELQLPFVQQESSTANKQEYIFSINLRELSMHLLKERKEWPIHGQTIASKYICALGDSARLLCHLLCLTAHLEPTKNKDRGPRLIDALEWEVQLKLFILMEHYSLALTTLACPLPQGFTPFFVYLGYRVLSFDQFLWHVRAGTFDLQIDIVKSIMADLKDDVDGNVTKKLHLLSLVPKIRANRILNGWSHNVSICLKARQHASDLLNGSVSQGRRRATLVNDNKNKKDEILAQAQCTMSPLDTFFQLLTAKANLSDIDVGLLTAATLISMEDDAEKIILK